MEMREEVRKVEISDSPKDINYKYYIYKYDKLVKKFVSYLDDKSTKEEFTKNETQFLIVKFYINELELNLARAVIHVMAEDIKWLLEKQNYSYFLVEAFFLCACKNFFNINENKEDFINGCIDYIYPRLDSIFKKVNASSYSVVSSGLSGSMESGDTALVSIDGTKRPVTVFFFRDNSNNFISDFINNVQKKTSLLGMLRSMREIKNIVDFFKKFHSEKGMENLISDISNSIEFREKMSAYYKEELKFSGQTACLEKIKNSNNGFRKFLIGKSAFIAKMIDEEIKDKTEELPKELKVSLTKTKYQLQVSAKASASLTSSSSKLALSSASKTENKKYRSDSPKNKQ